MSLTKPMRKTHAGQSKAGIDQPKIAGQDSALTTTIPDWQKRMRRMNRERREFIRIVEKYGIHNFSADKPEYQLGLEAYDRLPPLLEDKYGMTDVNPYFRWQFGRTMIDLFVFARRGGKDVLVIGNVKMNLEAWHFDQLKRWVKVVEERYRQLNGREIIPLIVVASAPETEMRLAARRGVIVVQNHEWLAYPAE
ncbi:MAG: hypothetical protein ACREEM_16150 [Blastocatellia bacterium]